MLPKNKIDSIPSNLPKGVFRPFDHESEDKKISNQRLWVYILTIIPKISTLSFVFKITQIGVLKSQEICFLTRKICCGDELGVFRSSLPQMSTLPLELEIPYSRKSIPPIKNYSDKLLRVYTTVFPKILP